MATWMMTTSQCLEQLTSKVTDLQTAIWSGTGAWLQCSADCVLTMQAVLFTSLKSYFTAS